MPAFSETSATPSIAGRPTVALPAFSVALPVVVSAAVSAFVSVSETTDPVAVTAPTKSFADVSVIEPVPALRVDAPVIVSAPVSVMLPLLLVAESAPFTVPLDRS